MKNEISLKELTAHLEMTARRAQQLAAAGVFVKTERGKYLLCESAINYTRFLRRHAGSEAGLPATLDDIACCIGETVGNARNLEGKGMFVKLSHGRYDLVESVRRYIEANKAGWRGRGRLRQYSCGSPVLPLQVVDSIENQTVHRLSEAKKNEG